MARAHSIWIVRDFSKTDAVAAGELHAAFTVKHELDTWLTRTYAPHGERNPEKFFLGCFALLLLVSMIGF